jgi:hypothetical protein
VGNVYIATDNKTNSITAPYSFKEKQQLMMELFDIPEDNIIQTKRPHAPEELLSDMPKTTKVVFAMEKTDAHALYKKKYYIPYTGNHDEMVGFRQHGYVLEFDTFDVTINGKLVSSQKLLSILGNPQITDRAKSEIFTKAYGKFDKNAFNSMQKVAADVEEANKLTKTYATDGDKRPESEPETSRGRHPAVNIIPPNHRKPAAKKIDKDKLITFKEALKQKIINPKTKEEIYIASAIKYDKKEPAYRVAQQTLDRILKR